MPCTRPILCSSLSAITNFFPRMIDRSTRSTRPSTLLPLPTSTFSVSNGQQASFSSSSSSLSLSAERSFDRESISDLVVELEARDFGGNFTRVNVSVQVIDVILLRLNSLFYGYLRSEPTVPGRDRPPAF